MIKKEANPLKLKLVESPSIPHQTQSIRMHKSMHAIPNTRVRA